MSPNMKEVHFLLCSFFTKHQPQPSTVCLSFFSRFAAYILCWTDNPECAQLKCVIDYSKPVSHTFTCMQGNAGLKKLERGSAHPLIGRRLWFSLPALLWRSLSLCVSGFASFVFWSLCHLCLISFSSVFKVLSCFPSSCLCFPGISFCLLHFVVSCFFVHFFPSSLIKARFLLPGLDPVFCIFNKQNIVPPISADSGEIRLKCCFSVKQPCAENQTSQNQLFLCLLNKVVHIFGHMTVES